MVPSASIVDQPLFDPALEPIRYPSGLRHRIGERHDGPPTFGPTGPLSVCQERWLAER